MLVATFVSLFSAFVLFAQAQDPAYLQGLSQALAGANLTRLAQAAASINSTSTGKAVLSALPNGNWTFLAPNDGAFEGVPANISGNPDAFANVLSYHLLSGSFTADSFQTTPNVTIARTLQNGTTYLEGSKSQVIALSKQSNGTIQVLNQNTYVTVRNSTAYQNLNIHIVNAVIDLPGPFSWAADANNLTALVGALQQGDLFDEAESQHGITIFAPTDSAFETALASFGSTPPNASVIAAVLGNHIVNGTTLYSTSFVTTSNVTSASGEPLSYSQNSTGSYVTSGSSTAKVVKSDIILWNGVMHIIDGVLLNTQTNPGAASSAYQSATSVAASPTTETGPVGSTPTPTGGQASGTASHIKAPTMGLLGVLLTAVIAL